MILLNTRFNLEKDFNRKTFMNIVKDWINGSQYLTLTVDDFDFESDVDYQTESEDKTFKIVINNYDSRFIFQVINNDEGSIFDTVYVLDDKSDEHSMFVQQNHTYETYAVGLRDPELKVPNILKTIFWDEYGGMDGSFVTDNKALVFRKSDVKLAESIVKKQVEMINPIVYVSPSQIRKFHLKTGDVIRGGLRPKSGSDKFGALIHLDYVDSYKYLRCLIKY